MARKWVKLWVSESLTGTIRFDFTPAERCVWYELVLLGGYCRQDGLIGAGTGQPFPDDYIASMLNVPLELLQTTLKKCFDTDRIEKNGSGYRIINWEKYQSEYERQKKYRNKGNQENTDPEKYTQGKYGKMVQR